MKKRIFKPITATLAGSYPSSPFSSDASSRSCTCYIARKVQGHCADLIVIIVIMIVVIVIVIIMFIVFIVFIKGLMLVMMTKVQGHCADLIVIIVIVIVNLIVIFIS